MMFGLAVRSLLSHPVRSAVLAGGFGLGVSVMVSLLGIGEVILEQARAPALAGGGDLVVAGATGRVTSARFILSSALNTPPLNGRASAASPTVRTTLYLVRNDRVVPVRARAGIPSLERAIGDDETAAIEAWTDAPPDAAWTSPAPGDVLRAMDRFHPIPDVPARAESWAEWLYFNGHAGETRFYLTFLVGPRRESGRRAAGVRLQLDRDGRVASYSESAEIDEAQLLADAPDMTIGRSRVRLEGDRYLITIDLLGTPDATAVTQKGRTSSPGGPRITGDIVLEAKSGRSLPPITIKGTGGWVSGYVVPVMSGTLGGTLNVAGEVVSLERGTGYHDHNWGYWEGVSWQWGQVQGGGLSFVYGRISPPADAADADRIPGFLAVLGPDGPLGHSTNVSIEETDATDTGQPRRIVVQGRSRSLDLTMELDIEDVLMSRMDSGSFASTLDFYQLRATYHVVGRAGDRSVDFTSPGAAETFRGR